MASLFQVAGFQQGGIHEADLGDLSGDPVDLNPVSDPNAAFAHQHEPAEETRG